MDRSQALKPPPALILCQLGRWLRLWLWPQLWLCLRYEQRRKSSGSVSTSFFGPVIVVMQSFVFKETVSSEGISDEHTAAGRAIS